MLNKQNLSNQVKSAAQISKAVHIHAQLKMYKSPVNKVMQQPLSGLFSTKLKGRAQWM